MTTPRAATLLARCSAIVLLVYTLIRSIITLNPSIPCSLLNRTDVYTPLGTITVWLLLFQYALSLPLLGLAVYQMCIRAVQHTTAMLNAILYGVFLVLHLLGGLIGSYITTLTAAWDGADAVATVGAIRTFLVFFDPLGVVACVLLGGAVAITAYAASRSSGEATPA